jgi:hypothetical protein
MSDDDWTMTARAVGAWPFVRSCVVRGRRLWTSDLAQLQTKINKLLPATVLSSFATIINKDKSLVI